MAFDPSNIKEIEYNGTNLEILQIGSVPEYDTIEYDLDDEKDLKNYLKCVESTIRHSFEYIEYIKYLREYMDMNKCSYFESINNIESTKIKIHIHHSPITLYEIVVTILEKRKFYNESLDVEMVAREAMYTHYCLLIGLIPVCETIHTLIHNEYLFVPNNKVMGKYYNFIQMYDPWIPWQVKEKYERLEQFTRTYNEELNRGLLEPHYIYLDFSGTYKLPKTEDIITMLEKRMDYLRENNYSMEPPKNKSFIVWNN